MFFKFVLMLPYLMGVSMMAHAGSVGDSAYTSNAPFDCDRRERFINCSADMKQHILDKCYVVVQSQNRLDCSWQSCGFMSVVQQRAKIVGTDVIEYGVKTPISADTANNPPANWGCDANKAECLPKAPYSRTYYTVRDALALRKTPSASADAKKLSEVPEDVLDANPYLECAKRGDQPSDQHVHVHLKFSGASTYPLSSINTVAVKVHQSKAKSACDSLKSFDKNGSCFVTHGDDRIPTPGNAVALENFSESSFSCPDKKETRDMYNLSSADQSKGETCLKETQTRSRPQKRSHGVCANTSTDWSAWSGSFTERSCISSGSTPANTNTGALQNSSESSSACPDKKETRNKWNFATAYTSRGQTCQQEEQTRTRPQEKRKNGNGCKDKPGEAWSAWSGTFQASACFQRQ
jgi:hypothetical protein